MRHVRTSGVLAAAAASFVGAAWGAGPAAAAPRANAFEGTCRLTGRLSFHEPLGNEPRATTFGDVAAGTCSGRLNGRAIDGVPVRNRASGSGTLSCLGGYATTADTLRFPHGVKVHFRTVTAGAVTQFAARFAGAASGQGVVRVDTVPYADQSLLAACAAGTLRSARYDLLARTITPVVG